MPGEVAGTIALPAPIELWIDPAPREGWENMAIDHAMLDLAERADRHLWRLYRWQPHCLSFGRHEPARRRYDRQDIEARGIATVRRPTGGRAVWHGRELTYAVAAPNAVYGSLRVAYRTIHAALARAVGILGGAPTLAGDRTTPGLGSGACFEAAVGGEVVVGDRKVVGSAQRRGAGALLQHGSMLLGDDQELVRSVQRTPPPPGDRPEGPLSILLGRAIGFDEAARAVASALEVAPGPPPAGTPNEVLAGAARHYDWYRSPSWTWDR